MILVACIVAWLATAALAGLVLRVVVEPGLRGFRDWWRRVLEQEPTRLDEIDHRLHGNRIRRDA